MRFIAKKHKQRNNQTKTDFFLFCVKFLKTDALTVNNKKNLTFENMTKRILWFYHPPGHC